MASSPPLSHFLELRPAHQVDPADLFAAIQESAPAVAPWLPDLAGVRSAEGVRHWQGLVSAERAAGTGYHFGMVDQRNGRVLGACGLTSLNRRHNFANLYYWVRTSCTRQGLASAAVRLAARFAFQEAGLQRVEVVVDVDNTASLRAAEKSGAVREAVLRNRLSSPTGNKDAVMFSLIPSDLAER